MRRAGFILALVLVAACSRSSRVEVTVRPGPALSPTLLAHVQSLVISVSGDETAQQSYSIKSPLQVQRLVYHPLATSSKLLVQVSALDSASALVATGQAPVALTGGAVPATITLHVPVPVTVTPTNAAIAAGSKLQLAANVPVHWSIKEDASGGTVDGNGLYVAPAHAGQFHVVATSVDDITQSATATVTSLVLDLLAGQLGGGSGFADGVGLDARFILPGPIASDGKGNLYVGDICAVRKVQIASGTVETIAGSADCGPHKDGIGKQAVFSIIQSLAADANGDIYLIDNNGGSASKALLCKLTVANRQVTTIAGGAGKTVDGSGSAAGFHFPQGIAAGLDGNVYIGDACAVRRVRPSDGLVTTVAGDVLQRDCYVLDQNGANARFGLIQTMAIDPTNGNFYVTDSLTVRRMTPALDVKTLAGVENVAGNNDGTGDQAHFTNPTGLAIDAAGSLYVSDTDAYLIRRMTLSDNNVTTFAGGSAGHLDGVGTAGQLGAPWGVAFDSASASLYIAEISNVDVRQLNLASKQLSAFVGNSGNYGHGDGMGAQASFWSPIAVAEAAPGTLFVADSTNATIRQVDAKTGQVDTVAGLPTQPGTADGMGSVARLTNPTAITADAAGHVYVGDFGRVRLLDAATHALTTLAGGTSGCLPGAGTNARLQVVSGLALGTARNLFVLDAWCHTLNMLDLDTHVVTLLAGTPGKKGHVDGAAAMASFGGLWGMAYDGQDTIYLADGTRVRAYSISSKMVSTLAGSDTIGYADGTGAAAQFHNVMGLAFDGRSTLYAADGTTIRTIALPSAVVSTWAGAPASYSQVKLGPLPAALNAPAGLIFTADRSVVFTDSQENALLIVRGPL